MDYAASNGDLDTVKFLHENRSEGCTVQAMDGAANGGHFEVLQFLYEHREEGCTRQAMEGAATAGHLNVVRLLHEHRDEGDTWLAMLRAATHGHLDVVKYLHVNSLEDGTARAIDGAVSNNHLNVVKYLIWDVMVEEGGLHAMTSAVQHEQDDIVKFICNYSSEFSDADIIKKEGAIKCCDKLCHLFLHSDEVIMCAAKNGNYGV